MQAGCSSGFLSVWDLRQQRRSLEKAHTGSGKIARCLAVYNCCLCVAFRYARQFGDTVSLSVVLHVTAWDIACRQDAPVVCSVGNDSVLQRWTLADSGMSASAPIRMSARVPPLLEMDLPLNAVTLVYNVRIALLLC